METYIFLIYGVLLVFSVEGIPLDDDFDLDSMKEEYEKNMDDMKSTIQSNLNDIPTFYSNPYPNFYDDPSFPFGPQGSFRPTYIPFNPFYNTKFRMPDNFKKEMDSLSGLGRRIQSQVEESLKPLKIMETYSKMIKGIGGKTVVMYASPKPTKFLAENGEIYKCNDEKIDNDPKCNSKTVFEVKEPEDYCYVQTFARVNDKMCLSSSSNGGLSIVVINNKVTCSNGDRKPTLLLTEKEYKKMCGRGLTDVNFTYYPDSKSPLAYNKDIKDPLIKCEDNGKGGCSF